jgi:DNA-binding NarL/FixJ family response regulator
LSASTLVGRVAERVVMANTYPGVPSAGHALEGIHASRPPNDTADRHGISIPLASHTVHLPWVAQRSNRLPCTRILIVDDCTLHRESVAAITLALGGFIPAAAWDVPSLRAELAEVPPDIVLLSMVARDAQALLRAVGENCPHTKVIVTGLSEHHEAEIIACAEAGVAGYHLRTDSLDDLLVLVSKLLDGESYCSPKVSAILLRRLSALAARRQPEAKALVLTSREIQILRMLEMGLSNRDIADRLCIALHTVKNHVHSVLSKLGVSTRAEAAAYSRSRKYTDMSIRGLGTQPA